MPRQIRVQYPGAIYHVMSRGDRREDIYLDDVDRQEFLEECERHTPSLYERRYFWWIGKRNPASGILKAIEPIYGLTLRRSVVLARVRFARRRRLLPHQEFKGNAKPWSNRARLRHYWGATRPSLFSVIVLWLALSVTRGETNSIIVPKEQANSFGDRVGVFFSAYGFAEVYGTAEFVDVPSDVMVITGIAFRWDERYNDSFEVVAPSIQLWMKVSTYNGGNFFDYVKDATPVFKSTNMRFTAQANRTPGQFDIVFPLEKPFVYDRRRGYLLLQGTVDPIAAEVDAQFTFGRGSYTVLPGSTDFDRKIEAEMMVTQLYYHLPPEITAIDPIPDGLQIEFTSDSGVTKTVIEGSPSVLGPFHEQDAQLSEIAPGKMKALLAMPIGNLFVRICVTY